MIKEMEREKRIRDYFISWIQKDSSVVQRYFHPEIVYIECYGPKYNGIEQVMKWFEEWNKIGSVLEWRIKQIICQNNFYAVEWYFKCDYENNVEGFDGVSIIEFNNKNEIILVKEFQSKAEHYLPYEQD